MNTTSSASSSGSQSPGQGARGRDDWLLFPRPCRGGSVAQDAAKFQNVTHIYYEQLNGYEHLKQVEIGYSFYPGS